MTLEHRSVIQSTQEEVVPHVILVLSGCGGLRTEISRNGDIRDARDVTVQKKNGILEPEMTRIR